MTFAFETLVGVLTGVILLGALVDGKTATVSIRDFPLVGFSCGVVGFPVIITGLSVVCLATKIRLAMLGQGLSCCCHIQLRIDLSPAQVRLGLPLPKLFIILAPGKPLKVLIKAVYGMDIRE